MTNAWSSSLKPKTRLTMSSSVRSASLSSLQATHLPDDALSLISELRQKWLGPYSWPP